MPTRLKTIEKVMTKKYENRIMDKIIALAEKQKTTMQLLNNILNKAYEN